MEDYIKSVFGKTEKCNRGPEKSNNEKWRNNLMTVGSLGEASAEFQIPLSRVSMNIPVAL